MLLPISTLSFYLRALIGKRPYVDRFESTHACMVLAP